MYVINGGEAVINVWVPSHLSCLDTHLLVNSFSFLPLSDVKLGRIDRIFDILLFGKLLGKLSAFAIVTFLLLSSREELKVRQTQPS